ncbi:hypothetical protein [Pseudofrankia inefficax]|uniref:hypothetical protein n=1 Tax=Pseudofrankia inefficax (strain DSM 45817 / CECT 9037 / DDB 130130 / EuI1c) TaxID=298654 RepID=UPI00031ED312|nr:hypothetical protein [Pseudofrankia inefficax]
MVTVARPDAAAGRAGWAGATTAEAAVGPRRDGAGVAAPDGLPGGVGVTPVEPGVAGPTALGDADAAA